MKDFFVHPQGLCESETIGKGTRIWAFAHVLSGARIGSECNVCDGVFVEGDVVVGDRVTVKCGVQLWDGVRIEDDVFVGPNATFTNDIFPRSKVYPEKFAHTHVRRGATIGANATLLSGIEIGAHAMIGAGAVVTRSVPPNAIVVGNPARIIGYVDAQPKNEDARRAADSTREVVTDLGVGGSTLRMIKLVEDIRGDLSVGEFAKEVPFAPARYFLVFGVPSREVRGEHAHKVCEQFLLCVHGTVNVLLDDGKRRRELILDKPNVGVHMPPMIWGTQYNYSEDAVLLVFASHSYDSNDYIRTYDEFIAAAEAKS